MRWIIRLFGLVMVLAVVAVGSLFLLPGDRIARIAADQITRITGRAVTLEGDTTISFYPVLGVSTGAVTIANAPWAGDAPMFRADSLKIGAELQALWGGDIRITGLEAISPQITLRRAADGRVNWELGVDNVAPSGQSDQGTSSEPAQSSRLALSLDRALIKNASVTFIDDEAGRTTRQSGVDFDLRWPDYDGTATFTANLRPEGIPLAITGHLDRVSHFIDGGVSDMALTVTTEAGEIGFTGRASTAPEAAGRVSFDLTDTAAFLAAIGLSGIEIPRGMGRRASAVADVTFTSDERLSLRDMTANVDGNALTGAADLALSGDTPRLNLQLNAGALDFSKASAAQTQTAGSGTSAATAASGWSTAPIDASALALLDAEVALVADSIDLGDLTLGKTRTLATLTRSRLVFDIRELRAYKGLITGQFVVNNRSGLSVGGDLKADDIDLKTLLTETMEVTRLSGTADGTLKFLGVGGTMQAIMSSLSGDGAVKTGRGVISGFDLDRLMRAGDVTGGTTVFDSASASFRMDKGNVYNNDLLMILPLARAAGEGRVGLGARDIDYVFTPRLLDGGSGGGLAIPVSIRGPWSNPRIKPDLEAAIDLNFKEEKKELERKARQEVEREVEKQLGIDRQDGQSLEDAAKDALEKELERGILKLFD